MRKLFVVVGIVLLAGAAWGQTPSECKKNVSAFAEWNCYLLRQLAQGKDDQDPAVQKGVAQIAQKYGYTLESFVRMGERCDKDPSDKDVDAAIEKLCGDVLK